MKFAVVEFTASDTVDVIPCAWFRTEEEDQCYWPRTSSSNKIARLVVACGQPDVTWAVFSIRVLGKAASYIRAREKLALAEETSDIQTDVEEPKRKKKRPQRLVSESGESTSEDESHGSSTRDEEVRPPSPPPPFQSARESHASQHGTVTTPTTLNVSVCRNTRPTPVNATPSTSTLTPVPSVRDIARSTPSTSASPPLPSLEDIVRSTPSSLTPLPSVRGIARSTPSTSTSTPQSVSSDFELSRGNVLTRKLLAMLEEVKQTQQIHGKMLSSLLRKEQADDSADLPQGATFPVTTLEELNSMDDKLIDPAFQKGVVCHLSDLGGRNTDEAVRRMLTMVLANSLCKFLTFTGRNNKVAFGATRLFSVIFKAVKKNPPSSTCSKHDVEKAVRKWIYGARDRDGNRARRGAAQLNRQEQPPTAATGTAT